MLSFTGKCENNFSGVIPRSRIPATFGSPVVTICHHTPSSRAVDTAICGMNQQSSAPHADHNLLTESEACAYLRIRPRQLYTWRRQGLIPYIKIGKALRFRMADVDTALERMTIDG